jgi:hypothetical protein
VGRHDDQRQLRLRHISAGARPHYCGHLPAGERLNCEPRFGVSNALGRDRRMSFEPQSIRVQTRYSNEVILVKTPSTSASKLAHLFVPLLILVGFSVEAADAPAPPSVVEGFLCNYNPGQDRDDMDAATAFYKKQAAKAGITLPPSFLWTLNKGAAPYDLVWLSAHQNLAAFGAFADANAASSDMAAVGERYDDVVGCQATLATIDEVSSREVEIGAPTTIDSYLCMYRPGASMASMGDLRAHAKLVNDAMGDSAPIGVYQLNPATGGPDTPDVVMFAVHSNTSAWAAYTDHLGTNPAGQALVRHFNAVLDCNMSLWIGERVIAPSS